MSGVIPSAAIIMTCTLSYCTKLGRLQWTDSWFSDYSIKQSIHYSNANALVKSEIVLYK